MPEGASMTDPDRKDKPRGIFARIIAARRMPSVWVPAGLASVVGCLAAVPPADSGTVAVPVARILPGEPVFEGSTPPAIALASLGVFPREASPDAPRLTIENAVSIDLRTLLATDESGQGNDEEDVLALQAILAADQVFAAISREGLELSDDQAAEIERFVEQWLANTGSQEPDASSAGQPDGVHRLSVEQRRIAAFISSRYRVALLEIEHFVFHAFEVAREFALDPHLVLAVVAVESGFDPKARSPKGAQGLMQVLTRVHRERFTPFGGPGTAFDPVVNLTVGSAILKELLVREGSIEKALKSYVGAALLPHDFGYGRKVLTEKARIVAAARPRPAVSASSNPIAARAGLPGGN